MKELPIYIFDLDGTLSDATRRVNALTSAPKDWDAFYARTHLDPPIRPTLALCMQLYACAELLIFTGRSNAVRNETINWFTTYTTLTSFRVDEMLWMRPPGDHTEDTELKMSWYQRLGESRHRVVGVFEYSTSRALSVRGVRQ